MLRAAFTEDRERLVRFECEAKLLASRNHLNIAHVYGFESPTLEDGSTVQLPFDGARPGEDLSERLKAGQRRRRSTRSYFDGEIVVGRDLMEI